MTTLFYGLNQRRPYFLHNPRPIAGGLLAENARGWIPRAIGAVLQPAPARIKARHHPDRFAHTADQMHDRRIDGYNEVEMFDNRSRILEILDLWHQVDHAVAQAATVDLRNTRRLFADCKTARPATSNKGSRIAKVMLRRLSIIFALS